MPKRGSCGSGVPGCRLSKRCSLAVHCCTSRACRDAHCTIFSPVCRHCTSPRARVALTIESGAGIKSSQRPPLSRCPTSRDFVPWRFLDAGQLSARVFHCCRRPKTSTTADIPAPMPFKKDHRPKKCCSGRRYPALSQELRCIGHLLFERDSLLKNLEIRGPSTALVRGMSCWRFGRTTPQAAMSFGRRIRL
jgi:hypothetical protein